nr:retrotransposon protein, putative, Ty1-copia subclass [Tanacetum cinerariifolium]
MPPKRREGRFQHKLLILIKTNASKPNLPRREVMRGRKLNVPPTAEKAIKVQSHRASEKNDLSILNPFDISNTESKEDLLLFWQDYIEDQDHPSEEFDRTSEETIELSSPSWDSSMPDMGHRLKEKDISNPGEEHWIAVKNILKYLRNTKDMFLVYGGNMERELRVSCYTDAGYLTNTDNLKSQTGYVFVLNGGAVDWKSIKQSIFVTTSTDAEYIAAFDASKEAVWIHKFISRLGIIPTIEEPISMYCDNTGAIAIAKDDGVTKGARHFYAKVHYLRETIKLDDVKIEKIHTDDNLADLFTKALAFPKLFELTRNIGLLPASSFM